MSSSLLKPFPSSSLSFKILLSWYFLYIKKIYYRNKDHQKIINMIQAAIVQICGIETLVTLMEDYFSP